MDVFGFVLISFLSLQIFQVEGGNVPTIYLDGKKEKISETVGITITFGDNINPGVCLRVRVQPFCQQVLIDRELAWPDHQFIPRPNSDIRNLELTFNCSETALSDNPVNVTAAIYSSTTPNQCETDQDHPLSEKAVLIYDDRGIV